MREMQQDAAQEAQMVSLWTEILFLPGRMPGAWGCEGENQGKKVRG